MVTERFTDQEQDDLFSGLRAGDERVFVSLMSRYQRPFLGVAYRFLQHRDEAEDAVQKAFLKIYRTRTSYRPGTRPAAWIYSVLYRVCLDALRARERRRAAAPVDASQGMPAAGTTASRHGGAEQTGEPAERQRLVRRAVAGLPEAERMAVILDQWEGLSLNEIGGAIQRSPSAVKSLLSRGRAKLRVKLTPLLRIEGMDDRK